MRDVLAGLIDREVKDPRVKAAGLLTVNLVELNKDMSVARVHVSFFNDDKKVVAAALKGLETAAGFLRGPAGRQAGIRPPELRFVRDDSMEFHTRIAAIVREDAARAVPDQPAPRGDDDGGVRAAGPPGAGDDDGGDDDDGGGRFHSDEEDDGGDRDSGAAERERQLDEEADRHAGHGDDDSGDDDGGDGESDDDGDDAPRGGR
jgi:ribosome-binding factor A